MNKVCKYLYCYLNCQKLETVPEEEGYNKLKEFSMPKDLPEPSAWNYVDGIELSMLSFDDAAFAGESEKDESILDELLNGEHKEIVQKIKNSYFHFTVDGDELFVSIEAVKKQFEPIIPPEDFPTTDSILTSGSIPDIDHFKFTPMKQLFNIPLVVPDFPFLKSSTPNNWAHYVGTVYWFQCASGFDGSEKLIDPNVFKYIPDSILYPHEIDSKMLLTNHGWWQSIAPKVLSETDFKFIFDPQFTILPHMQHYDNEIVGKNNWKYFLENVNLNSKITEKLPFDFIIRYRCGSITDEHFEFYKMCHEKLGIWSGDCLRELLMFYIQQNAVPPTSITQMPDH